MQGTERVTVALRLQRGKVVDFCTVWTSTQPLKVRVPLFTLIFFLNDDLSDLNNCTGIDQVHNSPFTVL